MFAAKWRSTKFDPYEIFSILLLRCSIMFFYSFSFKSIDSGSKEDFSDEI